MVLIALLVLAGINFFWQLGSSSYFVDEVLSVGAANQSLSGVLHAVAATEITPPGYFYGLHEWLYRLGVAGPEWVTRLPSALAGVALVAAVWWLASLVSDRRATRAFAAALAAFSPFVLEYAQLAQGYIFVALSVVVATAAAFEADRSDRHRGAWLAVSLAASVLSLTLHYTASLVIAPLCAWVATRRTINRARRVAFPAVCLLVDLALIPLLIRQHQTFPTRPGTAPYAGVTLANLANMLDLPFNGRVAPLKGLGVVVMGAALLALVLGARKAFAAAQPGGARRLVVLIAVGEPLGLVLLSALGGSSFWGHLLLTRYAAVAAPFAIVAIAIALETVPAPLAALLAGSAIVVALAGVIASHRPQGFYADTRGVSAYVRARVRPGDAVVVLHTVDEATTLAFYGLGRGQRFWLGDPAASRLIAGRTHRLWVIGPLSAEHTTSAGALLAIARRALRPAGYAPVSARVFAGLTPLAVLLEVPIRCTPRPRAPCSRAPLGPAERR